MRILGIDPGLRTTGFGSGPPLRGFTSAGADMSLHRNPCSAEHLRSVNQ